MIVTMRALAAGEQPLVADMIDAAVAERVAAHHAPGGQNTATKHSVCADCLKRVGRAGRVIAASRGDERRDQSPIQMHRQKCDTARETGNREPVEVQNACFVKSFVCACLNVAVVRSVVRRALGRWLLIDREQLAERIPHAVHAFSIYEIHDIGASEHDVV